MSADTVSGTLGATSQLSPGGSSRAVPCGVCPGSHGCSFLLVCTDTTGVLEGAERSQCSPWEHFCAGRDLQPVVTSGEKHFWQNLEIPRKRPHPVVTLCVANGDSCALSLLPYSVPNCCFSGWVTLTTCSILSTVVRSRSSHADCGGPSHRTVYRSLYKSLLLFLLEVF